MLISAKGKLLIYTIKDPEDTKLLILKCLCLTHVPHSYLAINISTQNPYILLAQFTQAYGTLDTLSSTIINYWYNEQNNNKATLTTFYITSIYGYTSYHKYHNNTPNITKWYNNLLVSTLRSITINTALCTAYGINCAKLYMPCLLSSFTLLNI